MRTIFLTIIGRLSASDWLIAMDIGLMIAILCSTLLRKRISSRIQIASAGLLAGYIYIVLTSLVLNRRTGLTYTHRLQPFWSYRLIIQGNRTCLWENLLNIILFIPIGFFSKITLPKWKMKYILIVGVVTSLILELLQLILRRGLCEFDDVFNNTAGTLIGFAIVSLGAFLYDTLFDK